ncbi:acyltransferase family protein [Kribbella sindirgiensis]|nr:acyltransferase [Kribbella sindirgiensis]
MTKGARRDRGGESGRPGGGVGQWAAARELFLDNLKVILIAVIIAGHAIIGYSELDWWSYADVREVTLSSVTVAVLFAVAAPFALLVVPLLFLIAGLLTPLSLDRKGVRRFVRDRLLRLGIPFVLFALLIWPLLEYALFRLLGNPVGLLEEGSLDTGVLWFIGALLTFSLVYAAWIRVAGPRRGVRRSGAEIGLRHLLLLVAGVTVAAFLVRLAVPFEGDSKYVDLNFYQWPASVGLFGLGIAISGAGWLSAVPDRLRRLSRTATLVAAVAFAGAAIYGTTLEGEFEEVWGGGWHWRPLAFAAAESALAVFGAVWVLGVAQRRLDRRFRWARPAISRSAYGAFMLQGVVLFGLAVALRPLPLPAEVKALGVATVGVAGCFALAWLLISRVPGVSRVL